MSELNENIFDLSDDEILNSSFPDTLINKSKNLDKDSDEDLGEEEYNEDSTNQTEEDSEYDTEEDFDKDDNNNSSQSDSSDDNEQDSEQETEEDSEDDYDEELEDSEEDEEDLDDDSDDDSDKDSSNLVDDNNKNSVDYEQELKKLFSPFKAAGSEMKVDNVDQAIQLMQKGAGFNAKMAKLKPNLKILKMLENNNLLDERKLSFLIDVDKKDKDAITKLIKESGIDPLEVDLEEDTKYRPNSYAVRDNELQLDEVIQDISQTDTYEKTLRVVGEQWDLDSRKALYDNPDEIRIINDHMANGIYEQVTEQVNKHRMLGNLNGASDYDAYRAVCSHMHQQGLFNGQTQGSQPGTANGTNNKTTGDVNANRTKSKKRSNLEDRKKAAGSTRSQGKVEKKIKNPFEMSDDEFKNMPVPK